MTIKIYHNPRCTKSRQTLQLLHDNGITPQIIEYLKEAPSAQEIKEIIRLLGVNPRDIIRKKEAEYKENNLDNQDLSEDEVISIIERNPKLIERPIVINGNKAAIGRPPENVLAII